MIERVYKDTNTKFNSGLFNYEKSERTILERSDAGGSVGAHAQPAIPTDCQNRCFVAIIFTIAAAFLAYMTDVISLEMFVAIAELLKLAW